MNRMIVLNPQVRSSSFLFMRLEMFLTSPSSLLRCGADRGISTIDISTGFDIICSNSYVPPCGGMSTSQFKLVKAHEILLFSPLNFKLSQLQITQKYLFLNEVTSL